MLFNSPQFFMLLIITLSAYWFSKTLVARQTILLIASLLFYGFWYPPHLLLLFSLSALAYVCSRMMGVDREHKAAWVAFGTTGLLMILAYYKYAGYLLSIFGKFISSPRLSLDSSALHIDLPLGISFITFQIIAYLVDVSEGKIKAEKNPFRFLLFVSFFPQLIAGPICRGSELLPQLNKWHKFDRYTFFNGLTILMVGLFLKAAFADNISSYVQSIYNGSPDIYGGTALWATIAFGIQILSDFWGYSTMAVGMALMFGVSIPINFNLPYAAWTMQSFWRRWHITLSSWLRDYLYIKLGGSRKGKILTYRNLMITMVLGGLWHGASTNFVIWGALHGGYLSAERFIQRRIAAIPLFTERRLPILRTLWIPVGWLLTMTVVFLAWVFFRADNIHDALRIIGTIIEAPMAHWEKVPRQIFTLVLALVLLMYPISKLIEWSRKRKMQIPVSIALAFWSLFFALVLGSPDPTPFIYFQF